AIAGWRDRRGAAPRSTETLVKALLSWLVPQKQLAGAGVVSLLRERVLGRGVNVTHPPLQRRALIERAATTQREARVGDASTGRCEPCRGLGALGEKRLVSERAAERVPPVALGLDLEKRPRRAQLGCDATELTLERFRLPHRHGGPQLLPAGIG